ncbi:MAG TPA: DNA repair protein RecN, partial [Proteobacteria bacterium]|nr:DNA repair protein RecN [Pseudomonadota bacterium]
MLTSIRLVNYAIFDDLEVEFSSGLNLLTGETGAGKSLLVGALSLLLGARADRGVVRLGADSARVEAVFSLSDAVRSRLRELQFDIGDGELVLARDLPAAGRSRFFLNGRQIPASAACEVARRLVQIYGQHEHQTLTDPQSHVHILDEFAGAAELFQRYQAAYRRVMDIRRRLAALEQDAKQAAARADYLRFVISEIEQASVEIGEDER